MTVAFDHRHYVSMPFLALFLWGFGYVGLLSLWQGDLGLAARRWASDLVRRERTVAVVPPPAFGAVPLRKPMTPPPLPVDALLTPRPVSVDTVPPQAA
jgi:hypothetical protein